MPITFKCSSCKTSLTVPDAFAGKAGKCPKCNSRVIAPIQKAQPDTNLGWVSAASYDPNKSGANAAPAAPPPPAEPPTATPDSPRKPTESWDQQNPLPATESANPPPKDVVDGARLTIVSEGRIQGCVFSLLTARCSVIGRDSKNEVAIPSSAISRHHCQIERSSNDFIITDLGSANGTLVNSERIISCKLKDGDYIQVGDTLLRFDS